MGKRIHTILKLSIFMGLASVSFLALSSSASAAPATFTVTNTNDSGAGSLRQAIVDANNNGNDADMDQIEFDIPGEGPHVIKPTSSLPTLVKLATINGYSQTGAQVNTIPAPGALNSILKIEVDGSLLEGGAKLMGIGISDSCTGCVVKGLAVHSFINGLYSDGPDSIFHGNYTGTNASGDTYKPNTNSGIAMYGGGLIGGTNPEDRNLISGNATLNIQFFSATAFGTAPSNGSKIQGNLIGPYRDGTNPSEASQGTGILIYGDAEDVLVGGTEPTAANYIKGVSGFGVSVSSLTAEAASLTLTANKVSILGNKIQEIKKFAFPNFGDSNLGIDILKFIDTSNPPDAEPDTFEERGPNANDDGDDDTGPNSLINAPVLRTAQQINDQLTVTYDLDVADSPSNTYRIEFFANSESTIFGAGPGEIYLGAVATVAPGEDLTATLTVDGDFTMDALSATATAIDATTESGFGSTSEFSGNISVGSVTDFDADGVSDSVEDGAPNNGDGNNDGILDKEQPTVTSYVAAGSVYATLATEGCSENGTVSSLRADTLEVKDNGYEYPFGLADFTLYCSRGDTVDVTMLIHSEDDPEKYLPRKFNPTTNVFSDIPGSTLTKETVGESTALQLAYSAQDGGDLDDDGEENGIIVDPVGLATEKSGVLANTGTLLIGLVPLGLLLIIGAIYTYLDYRKHRKPLAEADAGLASSYTYWHHLKVVAIPMAKYRLSIKVEKKKTLPAVYS